MDDVEWAGDDGVTCFECDSPGPLHQHHVIPRSRGGTRTVPLCEDCHGAVHGKDLRTSALTRDALAAKKARGERTGQPPFGWQVHHFGPDTAYVPNVQELMICDLIRAIRGDGATWRGVADAMNELGIPTKRGGAWHANTVRRILNRAA
jgi:hypothetical protein